MRGVRVVHWRRHHPAVCACAFAGERTSSPGTGKREACASSKRTRVEYSERVVKYKTSSLSTGKRGSKGRWRRVGGNERKAGAALWGVYQPRASVTGDAVGACVSVALLCRDRCCCALASAISQPWRPCRQHPLLQVIIAIFSTAGVPILPTKIAYVPARNYITYSYMIRY